MTRHTATLKRCPLCETSKSLEDFPPDKTRIDGRKGYCRFCNLLARRKNNILRKYGLTVHQYERLLEKQGGMCPGCGALASDQPYGVLCVDHDHETGEVRGLLCRHCNWAIGMVDDDPARLRALVAYLEATR